MERQSCGCLHYRALLSKLTLASDHRDNLRGRGLTNEEIDRLGYRTTPLVGFLALAKELISEGHGCNEI